MINKNENIFSELPKDFKSSLESIVQKVLIDRGVKNNSKLVDSIEFNDNSRDSMYMMVNDYYEYVSSGRKPRTKKVPLYALVQWIKNNNIRLNKNQTINQLAFLIQRSIYLNGIKSKNFKEQVRQTVTDTVTEQLSDILEKQLADNLFSAFKIK